MVIRSYLLLWFLLIINLNARPSSTSTFSMLAINQDVVSFVIESNKPLDFSPFPFICDSCLMQDRSSHQSFTTLLSLTESDGWWNIRLTFCCFMLVPWGLGSWSHHTRSKSIKCVLCNLFIYFLNGWRPTWKQPSIFNVVCGRFKAAGLFWAVSLLKHWGLIMIPDVVFSSQESGVRPRVQGTLCLYT